MRLRYLQAALEFLAQKDAKAAAAAIRKIRDGARSLIEFSPERGTPIGRSGFHQLFVRFGRSSYVIRYRVVHEEVVIVRVWHGRERRH